MSKDLSVPFDEALARELVDEFGSPLYVYDEAGIRKTAEELGQAFRWANGYKNYFAVKATPTPAILKILHEAGMGFDCSTRTELLMVQRMGIPGNDIFYTSNNTPKEDFELAIELDATINIDDLSQVPVFIEALNGRHLTRVAARYNPGDLKSGNAIIGEPTQAKYGMSPEALKQAFSLLRGQDIGEFGLHTMVASNELKTEYFAETASILLDAIKEIEQEVGIQFSLVNLGGGFGLNYKPEQDSFDVQAAAEQIRQVFESKGRKDLRLVTENGRYITGGHGYLLTRVRYIMQKYKTYVGVDASMHNLMRPGMYGAYHHITILGKEGGSHTYDVVGSLCENNDKFAIDRQLPEAHPGDILVIHDTGAHGHAMGFNYNGLLRSAEILLKSDETAELIRRAETPEDYFSTVMW